MTTYYVDVYRTVAQVVKVEADSPEEAEENIDFTSMVWETTHFTDDYETMVSGEVDPETGRRIYYF